MTETERAWLAGFLDGEGYLSVIRVHSPGTFRPRVVAAGTYEPAIREVAEFFAEYGRTVWSERERPPAKTLYTTRLSAWACVVPLLEDIAPFLRVKHEQATAMLAMGRARLAGGEYTPADFASYDQLRDLNKRGVA